MDPRSKIMMLAMADELRARGLLKNGHRPVHLETVAPEPSAPPAVGPDPAALAVLRRAITAFDRLAAQVRRDLLVTIRSTPPIRQLLEARRILNQYLPAVVRTLSDAQLAAALAGMHSVAVRVPVAAVSDLPPAPPWEPSAPPADDFEPEVRYPIIDAAVEDLQERRLLTRPEFDRLDLEMRKQALTVAGVQNEDTLAKIQEALVRAAERGTTLRDFEEETEAGTFLSPRHRELVFRVNIAQAYSAGLDRVLAVPLVDKLFPYEAYHATHDDRVRHNHLALEKLGIQGTNIFRRDDPEYQRFKTPWDFG